MKVKCSDAYIFSAIFILTLSRGFWCATYPPGIFLECVGFFLLWGRILKTYIQKYERTGNIALVMILSTLLMTGLFFQDLTIVRKLILMYTFATIIMAAVMSENYLSNYRQVRLMAYACFFGVIASMILCVVNGVPLISPVNESNVGIMYSFNSGIRGKEASTMMIAVIMSIYIYYKESMILKQIDVMLIVIATILLILSNSRGAWIEIAVFLFTLNYKKIGRFSKAHRRFITLIAFLIITPLVVYIYNSIILQSDTYLHRYKGWVYYLNYFSEDTFHMVYGNAELIYDKEVDYVTKIRSIIGWGGTLEMAWLNILIKNGILGLIAYTIIFARAIITAVKCEDYIRKTIYIAVIMTVLASSLVSDYIQSVHGLFGIYCYLIMAYYLGKIRENNYYRKNKKTKKYMPSIKFRVRQTYSRQIMASKS